MKHSEERSHKMLISKYSEYSTQQKIFNKIENDKKRKSYFPITETATKNKAKHAREISKKVAE